MRKEIEELFKMDITAYKIGKDTGLNINMLQFYKNGTRKIENMTLGTAEKLYEYYLKLKEGK